MIVGVGAYTHLDPLPAVANNVRRMAELLRDPEIWGLRSEHCEVLSDPASESEVLEAVHRAASTAEEAFLLYFAGHGLAEPPAGLHLALPETHPDLLFRALAYDRLRSVILTHCTALHKVIILDTCFSGRALQGVMAGPAAVADFTEAQGSYVMTSSAEDRFSLAPEGAEYTLFTGELLGVLDRGDPEGSELLDMEAIYRSVYRGVRANDGPPPQQRSRNGGARIAFVRNRARQVTAPRCNPARVPQAPQAALPEGTEHLLHETVLGLLEATGTLARSGRAAEADAVIAAAATRWPDQQTAALLGELHESGLAAETALACRAVAARPPAEVAACLLVLAELEARPVLAALFDVLADTTPGTVAQVAGRLQDRDRLPAAEDLVRHCIRAVGPGGCTELIVAFNDAVGLAVTALAAVHELITTEPDTGYVHVADALLERGFKAAAYTLYPRLSGPFAATRSREAAAGQLRAMAEDDAEEEARDLLGSVLADALPTERIHWALALQAVGLDWADENAGRILAGAADEEVLHLLGSLRRTGADSLLPVARWASGRDRDAGDVLGFADALRRYGLPLDAVRLLNEVVDSGPVRAAALIAVLRANGREEAAKLLARAAAGTAADRAALASELRRHGAYVDADRILAALLDEFSGSAELLPALGALACLTGPDILCSHLAPEAAGEDAAPVLRTYWREGRVEHAARFLGLLADREAPLLEDTLSALAGEGTAPGPSGPPDPGGVDVRGALAATLPVAGERTLARAVVQVAGEQSLKSLRGCVSDSLVALPAPALRSLLELFRWVGPSGWRGSEQEPAPKVWTLGEVLARRSDAALVLPALMTPGADSEPSRACTPWDLEIVLMTVPVDHAVRIWQVLSESGHDGSPGVLAALGGRRDLPAVLKGLCASGLPRREAVRIQRAAASRPAARKPAAGVARALQGGVADRFDPSDAARARAVLHDAARTLAPHDLGDLLVRLNDSDREADLEWTIASAAERDRLEDWLPEAVGSIAVARLDGLAARLVKAVVRRSRSWEVTGTAAILREDGLEEYARMMEEANGKGRLTRWLNR
ncbi:caspase, EACC1-associated type [Streptomyces erythrochromogenes]|uniref:caspase, EACC1-associated type n=1 Tax=Streptomyces erythrochromogenes TaxID=285574 RepID=UPI00368A2F5C